nr:immunoglobulin heavy chain junction region [Mus musculus]
CARSGCYYGSSWVDYW